MPSLERKLRKNAPCLNQSAISNFALYVINGNTPLIKLEPFFINFKEAPVVGRKLKYWAQFLFTSPQVNQFIHLFNNQSVDQSTTQPLG